MMNKDAIISAIAEQTGGTKKDARTHLEAFENVVVDALERGEDVKLRGFVDFTSKEVEAKTALNPKTQEEVQVPAHRKAKASLSPKLRKF